MQRHPNKRQTYPLTLDEQRLLFSELDGHMASMALFKVNTGLREPEVVLLIAIGQTPTHGTLRSLPQNGRSVDYYPLRLPRRTAFAG